MHSENQCHATLESDSDLNVVDFIQIYSQEISTLFTAFIIVIYKAKLIYFNLWNFSRFMYLLAWFLVSYTSHCHFSLVSCHTHIIPVIHTLYRLCTQVFTLKLISLWVETSPLRLYIGINLLVFAYFFAKIGVDISISEFWFTDILQLF